MPIDIVAIPLIEDILRWLSVREEWIRQFLENMKEDPEAYKRRYRSVWSLLRSFLYYVTLAPLVELLLQILLYFYLRR